MAVSLFITHNFIKPMEVRMDFNDMVEKMTKDPENKACICAEGYLPIYHPETGFLMRCHDPIIKTATLGKIISFLLG